MPTPTSGPRPDPVSRTGRVWAVADRISREKGRRATRREVIRQIVAEGGNPNTASTQYQRWKSQAGHDEVREGSRTSAAAPESRVPVQPRWLRISADGRLQLPPDLREALGGDVLASYADGELRLVTREAAIRRIQQRMAPFRRRESEVDAFLAQRRAMWGEEQGEDRGEEP